MRKTLLVTLVFLVLAGILLGACAPSAPVVILTATPTLDGTLRPYPSPTATHTPLPTDYVSPTPSPTVTPTPTPVYYEVLEGDDMFSIGWRFNVSPYQIMTANPTINPRAMGVGTSLLIPITPNPNPTETPMVELTPTATPVFSALPAPDCYPDALGGLWCFVLVENDQDEPVENLTGVVTLRYGEETRRESAILPLNLLPPGTSLPLIAYFQPPIPAAFTVSARVDFLLPVMPGNQRYLPVSMQDQLIKLGQDGQMATVSGWLTLAANQPATRYLWVNATAFDQDGHVVAVRRWDSPNQLSAGERIPFEVFLYSLGGPIDRVELLVEAQPVIEPQDEN
ncbi:MAG: LysM peptidoglycan-binding domain-containing protein [Brevefilum sp.]|nr:LysM peptidoglycan-binding domain-containing protein [Brevefilum sp.]